MAINCVRLALQAQTHALYMQPGVGMRGRRAQNDPTAVVDVTAILSRLKTANRLISFALSQTRKASYMDATVKKLRTRPQIEIGRGPAHRPALARGGRGGRPHADRLCRRRSRTARACARRPRRVTAAYDEFFAGYHEDPLEVLSRTFDEVAGYDDIVMLRDIELHSHCEHHMIPFIGKAHVAYFPTDRVVGISKLARVVEVFARRLQTQETMTAQIAETIDKALKPKGVAVMIEAVHQCMSIRGVKKPDVATITTQFTGIFKEDPAQQARFMMLATERGRG